MILSFYKWSLAALLPFLGGNYVNETAPVNNLHPFYISVTEINQNTTDKTLEVSCKFFADDFEQTIEKASKAQLDITGSRDKGLFDKYIPAYINNHLTLNVGGKKASLNYIGYEKDKESVYCYFEVLNVSDVKQFEISNNLLYDFTKEQINIMHVTLNGKRQSFKLNFPETQAAYQF